MLAETCGRLGARHAVDAWTIFLHADRPDEHQDCVTVNAFGDRYPADLAREPDVRAYVRALVADVSRYDVASIFAESGTTTRSSTATSTSGTSSSSGRRPAICSASASASTASGARPTRASTGRLQAAVRDELERAFASRDAVVPGELDRGVLGLAGGELDAYLDVRADTVTTLAAEAAEVADATRRASASSSSTLRRRQGLLDGPARGRACRRDRVAVRDRPPRSGLGLPRMMVLGYAADVERVRFDLETYRGILAEATLSVALRPCPPDCETPENLAAKLGLARELGLTWAGIYHYGFLRLEALDLIRERSRRDAAELLLHEAARRNRPAADDPPSSTTVTKLARLIAGQTWFGTIARRSPTRATASGGTPRTPCSSLRRATSQSSWPHTVPNEAGGSGTSIRSDVSTFEPARRRAFRPGRATTVVTTNAARSAGPAAPCAIWLRSLKTYVPGRTLVTPGRGSRSGTCRPTRRRRRHRDPAAADLLGGLDGRAARLECQSLPLGVVRAAV